MFHADEQSVSGGKPHVPAQASTRPSLPVSGLPNPNAPDRLFELLNRAVHAGEAVLRDERPRALRRRRRHHADAAQERDEAERSHRDRDGARERDTGGPRSRELAENASKLPFWAS